MSHIVKRSLSFVLALCMIAAMVPGFVLGVHAAEVSGLSDGSIGISYTEATSSGVVKASAAGTSLDVSLQGAASAAAYRASTSELTITNKKDSAATLSFAYTVSTTSGTVKIGGTAATGSGTYTAELESGASVTIAFSVTTRPKNSGQNNAAISINSLSLVADRDATTTFQTAAGGSYTVTDAEGNVNQITGEIQLVQHSTKAYTLNAAANEGYMFFGWYNVTNGNYISYSAAASYQSDADCAIKPVFISSTTAVFETGGMKFLDLGEAAAYADANGFDTVVLINSGAISGDYTIPAGVTLLIPFDDAYTCYTTEPEHAGVVKNEAGTVTGPTPWVQPYAFKTLTMSAGSSITVNGAISVSGKHTAGSSANGNVSYVGCPTGPVGFIDMAEGSEIVINNGGAAYVWGYIIGDGEITAKSGATVYENMQFTDFRGGSATLVIADPEGMGGQLGVFPLSQYYVQNIEVREVLESGANEYVYTSLYMSSQALSSGVKFMGEGAMFVAEEGGSISKEYLPEEDRLLIEVNGNAQINSLSLELGGTAIDSSDYALPINSNITININSGKAVINQDVALLPGSVVRVAEGAELNVAEGWNVYVYDATEWDSYYAVNLDTGEMTASTGGNFVNQGRKFISVPYSPTRTYTRTISDLVDVKLDINGKLTADGYLYTTISGADVTSSNGGGIVQLIPGLNPEYVEFVESGFGYYTYQVIQNGADVEAVFIPVTSIKLHNTDGTFTESEDAVAGDAYINNSGMWSKLTDAVVSFSANGGSGEMAAVTVTKDQILSGSNTITLASSGFNRTGYTFQGWATSENGKVVYSDGASVAVSSDLTLYAVWKINTYGVTFNGTDVTSDGAASVQYGSAYSANLSVAQCRALAAKDITVTIGGKAYTGFIYADGVLTIPAEAVAGEIVINAAATVSHTAGAAVQENVVAATCKDSGSYEEVVCCDLCGEELSREVKTIEKLTTHTPGAPVTENASEETCEQGGSYDTVVYCTVCGAEISRVTTTVDAAGHSYNAVVTAPTCEAKGYTTYTCSVCGDSYVGDYVDALGHSYTKYESNDDAACTADGTKTAVCDNGCGKENTVTDAGSALGHDYKSVVTAPTCEEQGYTTYTCARCGDSYVSNPVIALGHLFTNYKSNNDATCEEDGTKTASCSNGCGKTSTVTDADSALGHDYKAVVTAPTCEAKGYTTYTCNRCGGSYVADYVDALGHKYTNYKSNSNATCEEDGTKTASCDNGCGKENTVTDAGSALGHDYKSVVTAPTCEAKGYTTYTCNRCGGSYVADYVDALGHKYTNYKSNGDATCEEDGTKTASCDNGCGKENTVTDAGSALGHDYKSVVTAPTCEAKGYTTYTCNRCGNSYDANYVDALGHSYTDYKSNADATCTADGTKTAVCDNGCGTKNTVADTGSALGHDYKAVVTAPTCTEGGYTTNTCSRCADSYVDAYTEATGHHYEDGKCVCGDVLKYTVTFVDESGKVLQSGIVEHGTVPAYTGETPVKANSATSTFSFAGWTPAVVAAKGDATYTVVFTESLKNGFYNENGGIYHYVDGKLSYAGLIEVDGEYYYVRTTTGEVVTNRTYWVTYTNGLMDAGNYVFDEQGRLIGAPEITVKNGFYNENGGIYHYVDGQLSRAGLIYVDGYYYYVRTTTGEVVTSRTYWITYTNGLMPEGNYTFDEQGRMVDTPAAEVKNGFYEENGGIYHYVDGQLSRAGLIFVDGYYYYVRTTSGEVVTSRVYWVTYTNDLMDEGNYNFDSKGRMTNPPDGSYVQPEDEVVKNGFVKENGAIYYYEDGVMLKCGLIYVDGNYYYVRTTSGEVVTGRTYWITYTNGLIEEGSYTFDAQGRMILD